MKKILIATGALLLIQALSQAALVSVDMGSGSYNLRDNASVPLTVGNSLINGDGAQIFLGFYTDATLANPFGSSDANFRKLSGVGNIFGTANTTIGDYVTNFAGPGEFFINGLVINDTNPNAAFLPAPGTPLVVRVLDKQIESAATFKMEFANSSLWKWVNPAIPASTIGIDLDDANLSLLTTTPTRSATPISGGGNINTMVAIPEPSTLTFGALIAFAGVIRRRRRR